MSTVLEPLQGAHQAESARIARWSERAAPSIPALFFLLLSVLAPLVAQQRILNGDGDPARHIRHGLYMLQHHALIWHDPFSFTRPGQPFVPFEYGSQVIYALVYTVSGLAGVTIFVGLLVGATYALVARFLLRRGVDPLLVLFTTAAAAILGSMHWLARPHLISWLAIIVFFGFIEASRRVPLWVYPCFFAVWANLHGGWLYGIALLGIYIAGHLIEYFLFHGGREDIAAARHFAMALPLAVMATLATPMGVSLWRHLSATFSDQYILDHTGEFASPSFHSAPDKFVLALMLGCVLLLIASRRRMHTSRLLLVMAGLWWSFTAQRNIPLFGLTGLAVIALHLDPEWRSLSWGWLSRRRAAIASGADQASAAGWVLACAAALIVVAAGRGTVLGHRLVADSFDSTIFPVAAVQDARALKVTGPVFSDFTWGGYLLFAWPEQRVFIDGGTDFYSGDIMADYDRITSLRPGWRGLLAHYGINTVLTKSHSKLAHELVRTKGWRLAYCDSTAAMIRRAPHSSGLHADVLEAQLTRCAGPEHDD